MPYRRKSAYCDYKVFYHDYYRLDGGKRQRNAKRLMVTGGTLGCCGPLTAAGCLSLGIALAALVAHVGKRVRDVTHD